MKYSVLVLFVMCFTACKAKAPPEISDPIQSETSHHTHEGASSHTHEPQNKKIVIVPETGVYKPFDRDDKSTWGTVVETMPDGTPSRYFKVLPDGNYMTIIFSHALDTLAYSQLPENVDVSAPDGTIGSEHLHWNRPNPLEAITVQDATSKPGWNRAVLKAAQNWNFATRFNIQYEKNSVGGGLDNYCGGFEDGVIRVCNLAIPAKDEGDGEDGRMDGGYAQIRSSPKGHISAANVYLNDINYYTLDENVDHADHANEARQYLACHEVGHALGLGHDMYESFRVSCMAFISLKQRPSANLKPSLHDFGEIKRVSSHSHDAGKNHYFNSPYVCERSKEVTSERTGKTRTRIYKTYYHPQKGWRIDDRGSSASLYTQDTRYDGVGTKTGSLSGMVRLIGKTVEDFEGAQFIFVSAFPYTKEMPEISTQNLSKYEKKNCKLMSDLSIFEIDYLDKTEVRTK